MFVGGVDATVGELNEQSDIPGDEVGERHRVRLCGTWCRPWKSLELAVSLAGEL